jgi:hypothetical protein
MRKQQSRCCWAIRMETVFSMWFVPKCYKHSQSSSREEIAGRQFRTGVGDGKTWAGEAEESTLLGAVAREQIVKTQQAGKGLGVAVLIYELCRLAVALYITCSSVSCGISVSINAFTNPNSVSSHIHNTWKYFLLLKSPCSRKFCFVYFRFQRNKLISSSQSKQLNKCRIWGFHGGDFEEFRLLGCGAV